MAYVKNYPGGWQTGVVGGTPITKDTLDNIETQFEEVQKLFDAHSILIAVGDDTPEVLVVPASRIIGRTAGSDIIALTATEVKALIGWTANKILLGAGAGVAPTEINKPLAFTELVGGEAHQVGINDTWGAWDLSAIIGVGAKSALVDIFYKLSATNNVGVRKNGSALNRWLSMKASAGTEHHHTAVLTEVDANRVIECYGKTGASVTFSILGYWS